MVDRSIMPESQKIYVYNLLTENQEYRWDKVRTSNKDI